MRFVDTENADMNEPMADMNEPMLAINVARGFGLLETSNDRQAPTAAVRAALEAQP